MRSIVAVFAVACAIGCGSSSSTPGDSRGSDTADDAAPTTFTDFPTDPIMDGGLTGVPNPFPDGTATAPCVSDPAPQAVYPRNWLRPRFSWSIAPGHNVVRLKITVGNQINPLVVITPATSWTMPKAMWEALALHSGGWNVAVEVQSATWDATTMQLTDSSTPSTFDIKIAPVDAAGSIIYWTTTTKSLKAFKPGDESVTEILNYSQVQGRTIDCIGCHVTSPDGDYLAFSTKMENPANPSTSYAIDVTPTMQGQVGSVPSFVGAGGAAAMIQPYRGLPAFSAAHWSNTEHIVLSTRGAGNPTNSSTLERIDLGAATIGAAVTTLARTGDPGIPSMLTWSGDGEHVSYASIMTMVDARASQGPGDIYTVPYANGAGGTATKVAGASTTEYEENYPSYAPGDQYLSFTRVPAGDEMLFSANKEVFVVPSAGGTATRLAANDPPACVARPSPGVWNSFAKWAPQAGIDENGNTYYWLVFSSKRDGTGRSKLYLGAFIVPPGGGAPITGGAINLWNQPDEDNHTPSWDILRGIL